MSHPSVFLRLLNELVLRVVLFFMWNVWVAHEPNPTALRGLLVQIPCSYLLSWVIAGCVLTSKPKGGE